MVPVGCVVCVVCQWVVPGRTLGGVDAATYAADAVRSQCVLVGVAPEGDE